MLEDQKGYGKQRLHFDGSKLDAVERWEDGKMRRWNYLCPSRRVLGSAASDQLGIIVI